VFSVTRTGKASAAALALILGLALSACGDDQDSTTPPAEKAIQVTFSGDTVTPNGEVVEVEQGQSVKLEITADAAGEIHVHSEPEQELEYDAGTSTVTIEGIDVPGVVEVESHTLDKVIVKLEVH